MLVQFTVTADVPHVTTEDEARQFVAGLHETVSNPEWGRSTVYAPVGDEYVRIEVIGAAFVEATDTPDGGLVVSGPSVFPATGDGSTGE